jgi:hypothetical protein
VRRLDTPDKLNTIGAPYAISADEPALSWPPTLNRHDSPSPTPAADKQRTATCATTTTHPLAAYVTPNALVYTADTLFQLTPIGPKFVPFSITISPPVVFSVDTLEPHTVTLDTDGTMYDVIVVGVYDTLLFWPPMLSVQPWLDPTPATLLHDMRTCAIVTTHSAATNCHFHDDGPYHTVTSVPVVPNGPRFAPSISTDSLPDVTSDSVPPRDNNDGAEYDVRPVDATLAWPPTVNTHA